MIGTGLSHGGERGRATARRLSAGRFHLLAGAVLVAAALAIPLRAAAAAPDPMTIVKATVDKFVGILSDPALKSNPGDRRQRLKDAAAERFDFAEMGRSALGVHWRDLSDQQRKDFVDLFTRFVEAAYISRLESYSGQQIDFVKEANDGPDYAQVNTNIIQPRRRSDRPELSAQDGGQRLESLRCHGRQHQHRCQLPQPVQPGDQQPGASTP